MCTISPRRSLGTRPTIYKGRRVMHEKTWHNIESLIGGNILMSFLINVSQLHLSYKNCFILKSYLHSWYIISLYRCLESNLGVGISMTTKYWGSFYGNNSTMPPNSLWILGSQSKSSSLLSCLKGIWYPICNYT